MSERKAPQKKTGWLSKKEAKTLYMGGGSDLPEELIIKRPQYKKEYAQMAAKLRRVRNKLAFDKDSRSHRISEVNKEQEIKQSKG